MAFFARMSDRLNLTGSTTLRGEAGAGVIQNVLNGIGNPNDPGLEYLLLNAVGAPSGANVGFGPGEGALRKVYDQLRASSPLEAGRFLLDRIKSGRNPGLTGQAMQGIDDAANGNVPLQMRLYESAFNISREQAASLIGNGGAKLFSSDPKMLQRYLQGQGLTQDVQGGNRINNDSMSLSVAERDRAMMASLGNLDFLGGMEKSLGEIKGDIARIRYKFMTWAGSYENSGGSMAGTTGSGYRDPRGVPIASAAASLVPPSTATPAAAGRPIAAPRSTLDRTMWAMAQVETAGGRNIKTSSSGAEGLYQIQPQNISNTWKSPVGGPGGWDKQYLGIDAQNPDGSLVSTFEQGSAWLKSHPDQANRIATLVTQERMGRIRKSWDVQDYDYSEADVAGMAGAWWTSPDAAILDGNRVRLPGQLRRQQNPYEKALKTLSPGQYFDKMQGLYGQAPNGSAAVQVARPPAATQPARPGGANMPAPTGTGGLDRKFGSRINDLIAAYRQAHPDMPVPYILEGFRSMEKQAQYYAQGRTTPGNIITKARPGESMHNYGFAADLAFTMPNGTKLHQDDPRSIEAYKVIGAMAGSLGLQWGGQWASLVDMPHFEPQNYSWQQAKRGQRPRGYAAGGWTGSGPTHEIAGEVHYEEFVVKAGPAARYRRELERANAGMDLHSQQSNGGSMNGRIELSITGGASFQIPGLPADAQHKINVLWHQFLAGAGTILSQPASQPPLSFGGPR
jgi:peptidoglycan L-alanyl-D-glutamate endopeptidase CwlK